MQLVVFLLLVAVVTGTALASAAGSTTTAHNDVLLVVDTSSEMDYSRFFSDVLDFAALLHQESPVASSLRRRFGLILYGDYATAAVPLHAYSFQEWQANLDRIRRTQGNKNNKTSAEACCSATCCASPLAGALALAQREIGRVAQDDQGGNGRRPLRVFIVTASMPTPAQSAVRAVPSAVSALRSSGVRITVVAVPNAQGTSQTNLHAYFTGQFAKQGGMWKRKPVCVKKEKRGGKDCAKFASQAAAGPITSLPINDNYLVLRAGEAAKLAARVCAQ